MNFKKISSKLKKIKFEDVKGILLLSTSFIFSLALNKNKKDIWLVSERPQDAQDNGYYFFKYVRENHPEINIYYAIDFKSPAYKKVSEYGNCIHFGSFQHYIFYWLATKNISSQIGTGEPAGQLCLNLELMGLVRNKKVFLQHGVIKDKLNFALYENTKIELFCCGGKDEYEYVKQNYGYPERAVKYLGLCRFDGLHEYKANKKKILLMPTWRQWLDNNDKEFLNSEYFKAYSNLLNNKKLDGFLKTYNIELIFSPHNNVKRHINFFFNASDNIRIMREDEEFQNILKETSLLITDYSSVFFDYAYMKKPVIFYQFDFEEYRLKHYEEGYFNYESDGFGDVIYDEYNLVEKIMYYIENNYHIEEKYINKIDNFFELHDDKNCQRTFLEIKNM
ncbi:CDP-glycerol glycerophosphotransferase family protein [Exiguobacterium sp. s142]|uniref:CDP-glycerol glycerophosphotransferase family protein n=1 Tax=Exiguobacterium sp. s142 TaxID=2751222 RepID=UPI001BE87464|nr:CDP-glycerol glycerophosphotransferase family protein [Exiguobacterium sp. s142]